MAYAFVQDKVNTFTSTIVPTNPFTAGNTVIVTVHGGSAASNITISDGVNTYSALASIIPGAGANVIFAFQCIGVAAGSPTITATVTGATTQRIYIEEYSGLATFIAGASNFQNGPGTGANVIVGTNINVTSQPAMLWGYTYDVSGTESPSTGTSPIAFTPRNNTSPISVEDARILATGNAQVTFGNTSNHAYVTVSGAFTETATVTPYPIYYRRNVLYFI